MNIIPIIFHKLGFIVSDSGILVTTNRFSRFIANMAVREGKLQELWKGVYKTNLR